jgi:hypothetical protein
MNRWEQQKAILDELLRMELQAKSARIQILVHGRLPSLADKWRFSR